MSSLAVIELPDSGGRLQLFYGSMTLVQRDLEAATWAANRGAGAWEAPSVFLPGGSFDGVAAVANESGVPQLWGWIRETDFPVTKLSTSTYEHLRLGALDEYEWTQPSPVLPQPPASLPAGGADYPLIAGLSAPGTVNLFTIGAFDAPQPDLNLCVYASWQTEPNSRTFSEWAPIANNLGEDDQQVWDGTLCVINLKDHRLQLWASSNNKRVITAWKSTTHHNAPWSEWTLLAEQPAYNLEEEQSDTHFNIAAARRKDGDVQIWLLTNGSLHTAIQGSHLGVVSAWTSVSDSTVFGPNGAAVTPGMISAVTLSSGQIQLFVYIDGAIWTQWQTDSNNLNAWSNWERIV